MEKKIIIKGKRTFDKINGVKSIRNASKKWKNKKLLNKEEQINILNKLLLEIKYDDDDYVKKELERKLNSYKNQDIKKDKYSNDFINYQDLIEKLVISKLKCYYCRNECLLMYENNREKKQWTLDRLDNDMGHTSENTVICCLECNLKRGTLDDKKFKFTKQMKIIKKY
jgi:hypothetical protein